MTHFKNKRFSEYGFFLKLLPIIVLSLSLITLFGWHFDISYLKTGMEQKTTIKTGTSLLLSIISIIALIHKDKKGVMALSVLFLLLLVFISVFALRAKHATGIGNLICFWVLFATCISLLFHNTLLPKIGYWVIWVLSISAIIGYVFDLPVLYFLYPKISTAMSIHTAFSLHILATWLAMYLRLINHGKFATISTMARNKKRRLEKDLAK